MNYLLTIGYDGKNYCGWQIQPNLLTVQGVLEEKLKEVFKTPIKTYASGRTDTGVCALNQTVNFFADIDFKEYKLQGYLNTILPEDIRILKVEKVNDNFNARFSAKQKTYAYNFYVSRVNKPYYDKFATQVSYNLDMEILEKEIKSIIGTFDFTSFSSTDTQVENKERTIFDVKLIKTGEIYTAIFVGSGFLKNMIRIIMGTAFDVARGKIKQSFLEIINQKDRRKAGKTASPIGLVLVSVNYN